MANVLLPDPKELLLEIQNCEQKLYPGSAGSILYKRITDLEQCCKDQAQLIDDLKTELGLLGGKPFPPVEPDLDNAISIPVVTGTVLVSDPYTWSRQQIYSPIKDGYLSISNKCIFLFTQPTLVGVGVWLKELDAPSSLSSLALYLLVDEEIGTTAPDYELHLQATGLRIPVLRGKRYEIEVQYSFNPSAGSVTPTINYIFMPQKART